MRSAEAIFRSALDKPLGQLTEEDITQLTREDCRRYLKEKGMRRPSWNKSQAIEQVISLKTLLETRSDSDGVPEHQQQPQQQRIHVSRQPGSPPDVRLSVENVKSGGDIQVSANEAVSYRRRDPPKPLFRGDMSCRAPVTHAATASPRNMISMDEMVGQMTIFYCGKVNVYDGIPVNMAREIMQLAASPANLPQDSPPVTTVALRLFPRQLQTESIRPGLISAAASPINQNVVENSQQYREEGMLSQEVDHECPASRKASLQRYLEKRKDRGRFKIKKKIGASSSSSLEMYLNHQMRGQNPNEQSSRSSTCSPPESRLLHAPSSGNSNEDQAKCIGLSVDLNDNDVEDT